jgi:hypothetical protein
VGIFDLVLSLFAPQLEDHLKYLMSAVGLVEVPHAQASAGWIHGKFPIDVGGSRFCEIPCFIWLA